MHESAPADDRRQPRVAKPVPKRERDAPVAAVGAVGGLERLRPNRRSASPAVCQSHQSPTHRKAATGSFAFGRIGMIGPQVNHVNHTHTEAPTRADWHDRGLLYPPPSRRRPPSQTRRCSRDAMRGNLRCRAHSTPTHSAATTANCGSHTPGSTPTSARARTIGSSSRGDVSRARPLGADRPDRPIDSPRERSSAHARHRGRH